MKPLLYLSGLLFALATHVAIFQAAPATPPAATVTAATPGTGAAQVAAAAAMPARALTIAPIHSAAAARVQAAQAPAQAAAAAPAQAQARTYIGQDSCIGCHDTEGMSISRTMHGKAQHPGSP